MSSRTRTARLVAWGVVIAATASIVVTVPASAQPATPELPDLANVALEDVAVSSTGEIGLPDLASPSARALVPSDLDEGAEGSGDAEDMTGDFDYAAPRGLPEDLDAPMGTQSVIGEDTRKHILTILGQYRKGVYVESLNANYSVATQCTGFMVSPQYMLTAGHCVHRGGGGAGNFYPNIDMFPAYSKYLAAGTPNARCYNLQSWTSVAWRDGAAASGDWGIVKLSCTAGSTNGYFGLNTTGAKIGSAVEVFGYPSDKVQGTLWTATGTITGLPTSHIKHTVDTAPGQSGSPVLLTPTAVVAVHTTGTGFGSASNGSVAITASLKSTINGIIF